MKKIIASLLLLLMVSGCGGQEVAIVDYKASYKEALMEIAFQDPYKFFCGSEVVTRGLMPAEFFESENRKGMEEAFNDPLRVKKVLLVGATVAGFSVFFKTKEQSIESFRKMAQERGFAFNEEQIKKAMPNLKETDAECEQFAKIESLAVSQAFRGKGYGRLLLQKSEQEIKQLWPFLKKIELETNATNEAARKLYLSEGYKISENQPAHAQIMNTVQYEKNI